MATVIGTNSRGGLAKVATGAPASSYSASYTPTGATASVPALAPVGTPATSPATAVKGTAPVPKPAPAVFSPKAATTDLNGTIIPAMHDGNTAITLQNQKIEMQRQQQAADAAAKKAVKDTTPAPVADIPQDGQQWGYSDKTGEKIQLPLGATAPAGYSTQPPANPALRGHTAVASANAMDGGSYQQYSDGTYGKLDATGNFLSSVTAKDFTTAQANDPAHVAEGIRASLASLSVGAIPLTAAQQAQVNAVNTKLAQLVATQTTANANYTGGVTTAMNLYGMGNSVSGLGEIKGSVDAGVQKISDLQATAASSIASMTTAFQSENYKEMSDHYKALQASNDGIQQHIDNLKTFAEKVKTDAQDEAHKQFNDFMTTQSYNLSTKKQAFDQYMSQANLDESKKQNATDNYFKAQELALKQQAANPYSGDGPSPVMMTAKGVPSKASQAQFLSQFPANIATQIKSLADYSMLPGSFSTRPSKGGLSRADAVALAKQYDPTYNEGDAATRQAMKQNVTSGAYSKTITAANTLIGHLHELEGAEHSVINGSMPALNAILNYGADKTGFAGVKRFNTVADAVASEAATIYKGGMPSEKEIADWKGKLSPNNSRAQNEAVIQTITDLMASKLSTIADQYHTVVGKPGDFQFITDKNAKLLQGQGIDPATIDPTYGNSPEMKVTNFYQQSPENAKAVDAIMQLAPGATPDEVMEQLYSSGFDN